MWTPSDPTARGAGSAENFNNVIQKTTKTNKQHFASRMIFGSSVLSIDLVFYFIKFKCADSKCDFVWITGCTVTTKQFSLLGQKIPNQIKFLKF